MRGLARVVLTTGAALAGAAFAGLAVAGALWNRQTDGAVQGMLSLPRSAHSSDEHSPDALDGLPDPVVRYFKFALEPGQPMIRSARIRHEGEFRASPTGQWSPFESVQTFTARPAGFVWDARIRMLPLATVRVRDSYIDGRGGMRASVAGLVNMVNESDMPYLNAGALHRFFLEAPWLPTALLPSQVVEWSAVDDSTAQASMTDHGMTVTMLVHFAADGRIIRLEAERLRAVDGVGVPTSFVAEVGEYRRIDGMMIPTSGLVAWILPDGRWDYWRGRTMSAEYQFAQ